MRRYPKIDKYQVYLLLMIVHLSYHMRVSKNYLFYDIFLKNISRHEFYKKYTSDIDLLFVGLGVVRPVTHST